MILLIGRLALNQDFTLESALTPCLLRSIAIIRQLLSRKALQRLIPLVVLVIVVGVYWWFFYDFPYTRDAYISAGVSNVSAQVSGTIRRVFVKDNQFVKQGQALFAIDSRAYQAAVDQQQLQLTLARDQLTAAQRAVPHRANQVMIAQDKLNAAKLSLQIAEQHLQQTVVKAKISGYLSNMQLQVGSYIKAGQALFALINPQSWVCIARFRETVLAQLHIGDKVTVKLAMYPGYHLQGEITSIGWGINREQSSGDAAPSSLPYLKATEDWVRISQRFPVRIRLLNIDNHYPLRLGASASVYAKAAN